MYLCIYVFMYLCIYVFMYLCIYVFMYLCIKIITHFFILLMCILFFLKLTHYKLSQYFAFLRNATYPKSVGYFFIERKL